MRLIFSIIFVLNFYFCSHCQLPEFEVHIHDTSYMDKTIFMTKGNKDIYSWSIKDDLKQGKYYVYDENECGKDTLKYAEFSEDGVKNGEWKEWNRRLCGESLNEDLTSTNEWSFLFDENELSGLTIYKNNAIIKHFWEFPWWFSFYPENAEDLSNCNHTVVLRGDGTYSWTQTIDELGFSTFTEYDEDGNIWFVMKMTNEELELTNVEVYYPTGEVWAKGEITTNRVENGLWTYWDENGNIIAKVNFDKGEIIDYQRFQNKEITPMYIDKLVLPIKE